MRRAYQIICHLIAACVVIQAAAIAWATFTVAQSVGEGAALSADSDIYGFLVHSIVGQMVIPLLALALLIVALIGKVGIRWAAWVLVAVLVQVFLGYTSFDLPGLGILHGINAFVVLGLAETGARSVGLQKVQAPASAGTAADDSA